MDKTFRDILHAALALDHDSKVVLVERLAVNLSMDKESERERAKIRQDIIAGAKKMNDLYLEETKAWYPLEEEVRLKYEAENGAPDLE